MHMSWAIGLPTFLCYIDLYVIIESDYIVLYMTIQQKFEFGSEAICNFAR